MNGVIKRLTMDRGFGFIKDSGDGVEYFFHRSAVLPGSIFEELHEGQKVTFEKEQSPKGPRAGNVAVVA